MTKAELIEKIYNAEICIRCDMVEERKLGGVRGFICVGCWEYLKEMFNDYNKNGFYLGVKPSPKS